MIRHVITSSAVALAFLVPAVATAKPTKTVGSTAPLACGLKALPFAVGNTWTYRSGNTQVLIKVLEVTPGKDAAGKPATTIVLEEAANGRTVKTTATCTPTNGVQIPLDSFFFLGEPGGALGATTTVTSRDKATWLPDDQVVDGNGWVETVKADVVRQDSGSAGAKHAPSSVEIERHVNVKESSNVMIGLGQFNAQRVVFELRGRGVVGEEKAEIPIKRPGTAFLVKGVGYVKIEDAFDKSWELVDTNLVAK